MNRNDCCKAKAYCEFCDARCPDYIPKENRQSTKFQIEKELTERDIYGKEKIQSSMGK